MSTNRAMCIVSAPRPWKMRKIKIHLVQKICRGNPKKPGHLFPCYTLHGGQSWSCARLSVSQDLQNTLWSIPGYPSTCLNCRSISMDLNTAEAHWDNYACRSRIKMLLFSNTQVPFPKSTSCPQYTDTHITVPFPTGLCDLTSIPAK